MSNISLKSKRDIRHLRAGGKILALALKEAGQLALQATKKEVTTQAVNDLAEKIIRQNGGEPSFLHYAGGGGKPFPAAMCTSLNNEVVHGVPSRERIIKEGDLLKLDLGVKYKKLYTDAAVTIPIGKVNQTAGNLSRATQRSLEIGLEHIYPGSVLGNFGNAVDKYALKNGFSTVKDLVGHGVGYAVHEPPQIPNFGKPGEGIRLEAGMVIALEPMLNEGSEEVKLALDELTFITNDGKLSAHFEHTVAVTENGCEVLTEGSGW